MKLIRALAGLVSIALLAASGAALAQQPLKIGFGMSLTGPLAGNGKAALISMEIWRDDVNAKGGILGRKVEFVTTTARPAPPPCRHLREAPRREQGRPVVSSGTYVIADHADRDAASSVGLFGLNVNSKQARILQIMPAGPIQRSAVAGIFDAAMGMNPKPKTIAIVGADAEYRRWRWRARARAKTGLKIVYDKTSAETVDYADRSAIPTATRPVYVASYPQRRHGARRERGRVEDADVRRRPGRPIHRR